MAKKQQSFSKEKYAERILHEVNTALRRGLSDSRLQFVSITKVDLTNDYSFATIYWDTFQAETRGDAKAAIESAGPRIRSYLASVLNVKHVPTLVFKYDSQFEAERNIESILEDEQKNGKF
jgi:ribosome-binding factor A